jgi:hypothetical protein
VEVNLDGQKYMAIQPKDLITILGLQGDKDYELVSKAYHFLFDILCYLGTGSELVTNSVKFVKVTETEVIVSNDEKSAAFQIKPDEDVQRILQDLLDVVADSGVVKLPI